MPQELHQPSPVVKMMVVSASGWEVSALSSYSSASSSPPPSWGGIQQAVQPDTQPGLAKSLAKIEDIHTVACIWSSSTSTSSSSSSSSSSTAASWSSTTSSAASAETWPVCGAGESNRAREWQLASNDSKNQHRESFSNNNVVNRRQWNSLKKQFKLFLYMNYHFFECTVHSFIINSKILPLCRRESPLIFSQQPDSKANKRELVVLQVDWSGNSIPIISNSLCTLLTVCGFNT